MAIEFTCSCGKHYKLVKHYKVMAVAHEKASTEDIERLVAELLADEEELESAGEEELTETSMAMASSARTALAEAPARVRAVPKSARTVGVKSAPSQPAAPPRTAPQEKPAAAVAKTKPKQAVAEDAAPRVAVKYWGMLVVCLLALAGIWLWTSSAPPDPTTLAARALSAPDLRRRVDAAATLSMITQPNPAIQLRQLAEKSNDPAVLVHVLNGLSGRGDIASLPIFLGALEHSDVAVRAAAWAGVVKFYNNNIPESLEYKPDASAEDCARVARRLKEIRDELQAKVPKDAKA